MHNTTKALVLRGVDYKESDKILTLLTADMGKIRIMWSPRPNGMQLILK